MKQPVILILIFAAVFLVSSSIYTLDQTQQAIIVQLGNPVGDTVTEPGLHVKIPFIQDVVRFDKRWLEFDGDPNQIPTKDKKYIWVDTYARWRIMDPLRYYQAVRDELGAYSRLDDIVDGETRNAVASFDLIEIVRSSNRDFEVTEELMGIGAAEAMTEVKTGRQTITDIILEKAAKITPEFGIELVDVRYRLKERGVILYLTDEAKEHIITEGTDLDLGARPLRRALERKIEDPLAEEILKGTFSDLPHVTLRVKDDRIHFDPTTVPPPDVEAPAGPLDLPESEGEEEPEEVTAEG